MKGGYKNSGISFLQVGFLVWKEKNYEDWFKNFRKDKISDNIYYWIYYVIYSAGMGRCGSSKPLRFSMHKDISIINRKQYICIYYQFSNYSGNNIAKTCI